MSELQGLRSSSSSPSPSPGHAAPRLHPERAGGPRRVAARASMSAETTDFVLRRLFSAGLALGSCVRVLDEVTAKRVTSTIRELDDISVALRRASRHHPVPLTGPLPPWDALLTGMHGAVEELMDHMDALGRTEPQSVESPHMLEAAQSLQRAVSCLSADAVDRMSRTALTQEASPDRS